MLRVGRCLVEFSRPFPMPTHSPMCFDSTLKDIDGARSCFPSKRPCRETCPCTACSIICAAPSFPHRTVSCRNRRHSECTYGSGLFPIASESFDDEGFDRNSLGSDYDGDVLGRRFSYDLDDIQDAIEVLRPAPRLTTRSISTPTPHHTPVAKFLSPSLKAYKDGPSDTEFVILLDDEEVPIESCGWEEQMLVDRIPEVMCTDRITVRDFDDGSVLVNDFFMKPDSDLGCGSFCSFRLSSCIANHGHYALKLVSKTKAKKNSMLFKQSKNPFLNIERETAILKKIKHPNIVKLFEIMDDPEEDNLYFVFEYIDRGCILTIPSDSPLKESVAISYMRDALYGVEYLHSKNIIHRDLKPENMLLNSFGRVKLIDFGLSFVHEEGNDTTRLPYGTPAFTAPECLDEELPEGYSAPIMEMWALGVTLFALLFGHVPFYHDNLYELYRMIQEDRVVIPSTTSCHVSLNARSLLKGMLDKNVDERLKLKDILSTTVFLWKHSCGYLPEPCKPCKYYRLKHRAARSR
ncbi:uncharacterized protein LOC129582538 [Paramacrobiotus metropolitanus]|uniref:uncharacterized protein LOC129582538 n=1 Tax=Paramacrobiotus metropolitanus TaxID=2943436 RepID=UPI002445E9D7|nr:uncharacterized protein LOC129582538 [Paramacrobiotus metropolitanus]